MAPAQLWDGSMASIPSACLRFHEMQQIHGLHVNQVFSK